MVEEADSTSEPTTSAPSVPTQYSVQKKTTLGLLLMAGLVVFSRAASLLNQFVLGYLLTKNDYGLFATATAMGSVATSMRDGGAGKFLIQKGNQFNSLYRSVFKLAFIANLLISITLVVIGIYIATRGGPKAVSGNLMLWIALSVLVSTPAFLGRSLAQFNLNFGWLAKVMAISVSIKYIAMILFAFLGFGPYSFVLPLVLSALVESAVFLWYFSRNRSAGANSAKGSLLDVIRHTRWIVFGSLATALINNGDYLVLTQFLDTAQVGIYFFGFQLTVAVSAIFTQSIQNVLLPSYSRSQEVIVATVTSHLRSLFLISGPLCIGAALACPLIIKLCWQGKWDVVIPVAQFLLVALSVRLASPVCRAAIESAGKWKVQAFMVWGDGLGTILTSLVVLLAGVTNVATFAFFIAAYRFCFGLTQLTISSHLLKLPKNEVFGTLKPILTSIALGVIAWGISSACQQLIGQWPALIAGPLLFLIAYISINRNDADYRRMLMLIREKIGR